MLSDRCLCVPGKDVVQRVFADLYVSEGFLKRIFLACVSCILFYEWTAVANILLQEFF